jgi:hypothetical protein
MALNQALGRAGQANGWQVYAVLALPALASSEAVSCDLSALVLTGCGTHWRGRCMEGRLWT